MLNTVWAGSTQVLIYRVIYEVNGIYDLFMIVERLPYTDVLMVYVFCAELCTIRSRYDASPKLVA